MKKTCFILFLITTFPGLANGLKDGEHAQSVAPADTLEVIRLIERSGELRFEDSDSSLHYARMALHQAQQLQYVLGECIALNFIGEELRIAGEYPEALEALFNSLRISRSLKNNGWESRNSIFIGMAYIELGEPRQGLGWLLDALKLDEDRHTYVGGVPPGTMRTFCLSNVAWAYTKLNLPDSALAFTLQAFELLQKIDSGLGVTPLRSDILNQFGNVYWSVGDYEKSVGYYWQVARSKLLLNSGYALARLAEYYLDINVRPDSSLYYARLALDYGVRSRQKTNELEAARLLAKVFGSKNQFDSANYYNERVINLTAGLFGPQKLHQLQLLAISEHQQQFEIKRREENFRNSVRTNILLALSAVAVLAAVVFYRIKQQKNSANKVLEAALRDLKSTQSQLIQSEKMASLGELTAGIAHEIQNPLNFVNNFSEVNSELIDEMTHEIDKRNFESVKLIANNIKDNQEKINSHGKRADGIVKSMLQHSRSSSGQKELTDINALCDEYLRLTYHGYRAKDKSFNAGFEVNFDPSIPKVNVVPQDIGRVILNLVNNAFHAVSDKSAVAKAMADERYEPAVTISTRNLGNKIEISVQDNGSGIVDAIKEKIFQPFFTTKPTGQGTGLGLSLSYDIIKAHGGTLEVNSQERGGSEFIIHLPT